MSVLFLNSERDVRLLFALPKAYICRLSAILLSAIKIDRDDNKVSSSINPMMYSGQP